MSNEISSVSSKKTTAVSQSTSSTQKLTAETKKKLEALGIDTTNIKTEAEGISALMQVQQAQMPPPPESDSERESIKTQAKSLASKLGVAVSSDAKTEDILSDISAKLSTMQTEAVNSPEKLQKVQEYQAELDSISSAYSSMIAQKQANEAKIAGNLENMAKLNKIDHNL